MHSHPPIVYPLIVDRIYPIAIYKFNWHYSSTVGSEYPIQIYAIQGPNLPRTPWQHGTGSRGCLGTFSFEGMVCLGSASELEGVSGDGLADGRGRYCTLNTHIRRLATSHHTNITESTSPPLSLSTNLCPNVQLKELPGTQSFDAASRPTHRPSSKIRIMVFRTLGNSSAGPLRWIRPSRALGALLRPRDMWCMKA